ncbi:P-loop containing nucleoside triphosphate hydrolase protein [Epithele typhae]|uniref:P-loop containing nucleoside triphosphate hydrolase protein n=1 Tax=Epithele typhae TaxID=378194 RepID=UPI00200829A3|nr:P-loop containing nucleoside triphosphate hydrolase protein [Epithele typhae]KAH9922826.1 P-loop containing nucleoside triphosphate hydrolase protein [Epithele typhae]
MAHINKLAIRGIRSFDDKTIAVIEFFSPVTVIVGHNGSGKTTIIECLKYATTGDQPPNTRGGAFVHDPKMANEKEVKAQVKLRFFSASGQRMLAVRNLSVTVKKNNAMTMKTLESILGVSDDSGSVGKRGVLSTKCAEMDIAIPEHLGVSKAVLENVIFCHQEDSYWPLSEPAALKKKFDDIFEATKYTKALDNIKSLRKDRMAELKTEQARLEGLAAEKAHSDQLKARLADANAELEGCIVEHDRLKAEYDEQVRSNQHLQETGSKFREIYLKAEQLGEKQERLEEELNSIRESLHEIEGTDEELSERIRTHDDNILNQKQRRTKQENLLDDAQEQVKAVRTAHVELIGRQGHLDGEEKVREERSNQRDTVVRDVATKHRLRGYDSAPFTPEQISRFMGEFGDLKRKQSAESDRLQIETQSRNEEYNRTSRQMHTELEGYKQERRSNRDQVTALQKKITTAEDDVDATRNVTSRLAQIKADIEDKQARLDKARQELSSSNFDKKIMEKTNIHVQLENQREALNLELRTLSLQADTRAKLDLQRNQMRSKTAEIQSTINHCNTKFRKIVGQKDREQSELQEQFSTASSALQAAHSNLSTLKSQVKAKRDEHKSLDRTIKEGLEAGFTTVESAVEDAVKEVGMRNEDLGKNAGTHDVYKQFLQTGKAKKCCPLCTRGFDDNAMQVFEKNLHEALKKSSPQALAQVRSELEDWEAEVKRLQELAVQSASRANLQNVEIPGLDKQIAAVEESIPELTTKADEASAQLKDVAQELKDIVTLRQHAATVSRVRKDIEDLKQEIAGLESDLMASGSAKTADDVQQELNDVTSKLKANDREKTRLTAEQDRLVTLQHQTEREMHQLQMRENECKTQLRDKEDSERKIVEMRADIVTAETRTKELDGKIAEARVPIDKLENEYKEFQREMQTRISQAQRTLQDLTASYDKLEDMNKWLAKNTKEKLARLLQDVNEAIQEKETEVQDLVVRTEKIRAKIGDIDREIAEAGLTLANLRENLRFRRTKRELEEAKAELAKIDMEEAAKAKRIWTEKWTKEKEKETDLQTRHARLSGQIDQLKQQVRLLEQDQAKFKKVNKNYRDQLIRVKLSDMANNDLEKYAKALDNAIMKYHSLKMEEVNDTMRHLWNKTYQGTDIDGIKICSDSEGGATKRSYNYRVVMTKDQVEMDMRGRCSAGQKMLASIIIRLALADSFGQNCGILALDEPTNALDTENIDALAASLVDIINERKSNANFQLIIITHDENFLAKLGQNNVMEYYWRVSRDSRQKSVIERHRFG